MFPRFRKEDTSASREHGTKSGQCPTESQPDERVLRGPNAGDAVLAMPATEEVLAARTETCGAMSTDSVAGGSAAEAAARQSAENVSDPPPRVDVEPTAVTVESDQHAEVSAERCHRFVW